MSSIKKDEARRKNRDKILIPLFAVFLDRKSVV